MYGESVHDADTRKSLLQLDELSGASDDMSEAKEAPKGLQALFSRPRKFYVSSQLYLETCVQLKVLALTCSQTRKLLNVFRKWPGDESCQAFIYKLIQSEAKLGLYEKEGGQ